MHHLRLLAIAFVCLVVSVLGHATTPPPDWVVGDVFVGVADGSYQVWHSANPTASKPSYSLLTTISDSSPASGSTNGCGFDLAYRFFGTNSGANLVDRYAIDNGHPLAQQFPTSGNSGSGASSVQSVAFDGGANVYLGYSGASNGFGTIERWTKDTTPGDANFGLYVFNKSFSVPVDNTHGPGWIDLASDGVTLFYTSQGASIRTLNTATNTAGTFVTLSGGTTLFALRLLPGNGSPEALVAAQGDVLLVNSAGEVAKLNFGGEKNLQAVSLDPIVSTHAWVGDASSNDFILFDYSTKKQIASFNTGTGSAGPLGGVCVDGSYSAAEVAQQGAVQTTTTTISSTSSTVTLPTLTGSTFTETFVGLAKNQNVQITVRNSLVDPSLGLSDPTVYSFNFGGPGGTVPGTMICDTALTTALGLGNKCELLEVEANPNTGYTSANTQIEPPATVNGHPFTDLPNLRFMRNLDEDITDDLDIGGTRTTKCVYTANQQVIAGGFGNPTYQICSFTPTDGSVLSKSAGSSTIDFKLGVAPTGECSGGGNSGVPQNLPLLLMIVQLQTNGAAPVPVQVLVAGNSGGFPIMAFSGNTYQLQVKTTDLTAGSTYVASVVDLSGTITGVSSRFTLTK